MTNWYRLYSTRNLPQASIIKGMLEENGVPVMMVNKQDSSYLVFGDIELYVPSELKEVAQSLLNHNQQNSA